MVDVVELIRFLSEIYAALRGLCGRRNCTVNYDIVPLTPQPLSSEDKEKKETWIVPLLIVIEISAGYRCKGRCIVRPLIKTQETWTHYAPLISPELEFFSRLEFQPMYIETDFDSYAYIVGKWGESFTSAVAFKGEKAKLMVELVFSDQFCRQFCKSRRKFFDVWKILKRAKNSLRNKETLN